jgi:hypothetical protein
MVRMECARRENENDRILHLVLDQKGPYQINSSCSYLCPLLSSQKPFFCSKTRLHGTRRRVGRSVELPRAHQGIYVFVSTGSHSIDELTDNLVVRVHQKPKSMTTSSPRAHAATDQSGPCDAIERWRPATQAAVSIGQPRAGGGRGAGSEQARRV